uniref:Uncharacterized protein n=1 Tax=Sus scrofa TaxID=9823 RepID=A0A8D1E5Z0_PIG
MGAGWLALPPRRGAVRGPKEKHTHAMIEAKGQVPLALLLCHLEPLCLFQNLLGLRKPERPNRWALVRSVSPAAPVSLEFSSGFFVCVCAHDCRQPASREPMLAALALIRTLAWNPPLCHRGGSKKQINK